MNRSFQSFTLISLFIGIFLLVVATINILHKSWVDEAYFTEIVHNIHNENEFKSGFSEWREGTPKIYGPVFFYVNQYVAKFSGLNEHTLRITSAFFFFALVFVFFFIFKNIIGKWALIAILIFAFFEPNYNFEAFNGRMETMALFFSITSIWFYSKTITDNKNAIVYSALAFVFMVLGSLVTPRILLLYVGFSIPYILIYWKNIPWRRFLILCFAGAASYFLYLDLAFNGLNNAITTILDISKEFITGVSRKPLLYDKYFIFITLIMLLSSGWIYYQRLGSYRLVVFMNISVLIYANLIAKVFTETGIYYTLYIYLLVFMAMFDIYYIFKFNIGNNVKLINSILLLVFIPILYKSTYSMLVQSKRVINEIRSLDKAYYSNLKLKEVSNLTDTLVGPSSLYTKFLPEKYFCVDIEREQEHRVSFILDTLQPKIILVDDELKRRQPYVFKSLTNSSKYTCTDSILLIYNDYIELDTSKFGFWLSQNNVRILRKK